MSAVFSVTVYRDNAVPWCWLSTLSSLTSCQMEHILASLWAGKQVFITMETNRMWWCEICLQSLIAAQDKQPCLKGCDSATGSTQCSGHKLWWELNGGGSSLKVSTLRDTQVSDSVSVLSPCTHLERLLSQGHWHYVRIALLCISSRARHCTGMVLLKPRIGLHI